MSLLNKLKYCPDEQGWTNPNISRAMNLEKLQMNTLLNCEVVIDSEGKPKGEFSAKELLQIFKK
jgi:hypothetical protein